jgi:hypothetical protein
VSGSLSDERRQHAVKIVEAHHYPTTEFIIYENAWVLSCVASEETIYSGDAMAQLTMWLIVCLKAAL